MQALKVMSRAISAAQCLCFMVLSMHVDEHLLDHLTALDRFMGRRVSLLPLA
jgi:hypothetical protein